MLMVCVCVCVCVCVSVYFSCFAGMELLISCFVLFCFVFLDVVNILECRKPWPQPWPCGKFLAYINSPESTFVFITERIFVGREGTE